MNIRDATLNKIKPDFPSKAGSDIEEANERIKDLGFIIKKNPPFSRPAYVLTTILPFKIELGKAELLIKLTGHETEVRVNITTPDSQEGTTKYHSSSGTYMTFIAKLEGDKVIFDDNYFSYACNDPNIETHDKDGRYTMDKQLQQHDILTSKVRLFMETINELSSFFPESKFF
jgi:hypothetical protein